ncbi:MAG: AcfA family outer membrane beta-barrel protein [Shewanella sp.]|nr:AcfA family outer membrane beta-barrel protein [Shewanella sp.]MCF1431843.1 AcfA family outer membrane beta-barrel protein [Shewanella sp.]MCF1437711.1 AcfA family outer membrane beta-barrel protein [Shewanella sp.]MCF1456784.1 AcfA family outer membrane beta-barrel protein [Shewanella sp.]
MKKRYLMPLLVMSPAVLAAQNANVEYDVDAVEVDSPNGEEVVEVAEEVELPVTSNSGIYTGLEYGISSVDQDYHTNFPKDKVNVKPGGGTDIGGAFIGYRFENNLGVEFGYNQYKAKDSFGKNMGVVEHLFTESGSALQANQERSWDANTTAHQYSVKPVYFMPLTDKFTLKAGLGLVLTHYSYHSGSEDEFEAVGNDDLEQTISREGGEHHTENAVGGIASVGLNYNVYKGLDLGVSAQYQIDHVANVSELLLSATYQF